MNRALVIAVLFLASCKTAEPRPQAAPPVVAAEDFQIVTQTLTDCAVKYTGTVEATAEPVTVEKAVFEFVVDGKVLKSGEKRLGVEIAAGAKADFSLEESFTYVKDVEDLKAMDARGGSILMALRGNLVVQVKHTGEDGKVTSSPLQLAFARSREVRTPRLPHLKLQELEAGRFSESEVQITFHLAVVNPNPFVLSMSSLDYVVTVAGKEVANASQGKGDKVSPASTGVFDVQVTVNEETHGKDVQKLIKGLKLPYTVKGKLTAALYEEPLEASGEVKLNPPK